MSSKARCHACNHRVGPRVAPYVPKDSLKGRTSASLCVSRVVLADEDIG